MSQPETPVPPGIDTNVPSIARVYDAMLEGKDNFDVDRAVLAQMIATIPETPAVARDNRKWLGRIVRWLTGQAGVDQFLDLGSGLPTAENTHEVAQRVNPEATVVYVDNDPAVCAHGRALLEDNDHTFFCAADLTKPTEILADTTVTSHLDMDRPIALLQCLTLHHVADLGEVQQIMSGYLDGFASGSYVAFTHAQRPQPDSPDYERLLAAEAHYRKASPNFTWRSTDELATLVQGLELVEPGIVPITDWWPDGPRTKPVALEGFFVGAVARKP